MSNTAAVVEVPAAADKLSFIVDTMKEMSRQTDPQEMVRSYASRMARLYPADRRISLSRRGLEPPSFRITRYSGWSEEINPWKQTDRLPVLSGGLLGEILYGDEPRIIEELEVPPDDPAAEYLFGQRSLLAIPLYDGGKSMNMVVLTRSIPDAFDHRQLPEWVWMGNLFGRATNTLVLHDQLREKNAEMDRELQVVGNIQRSLLPAMLPEIPTMNLAAHYQTSKRAGGDYYDFFKLPEGKWGLLIADVSGHGTPAAVIMAIVHGLAHAFPGPPCPPGTLLEYLNEHLTSRYTASMGAFVTAFYGIYDPPTRTLRYASAGHNPPRLKRCTDGSVAALDGAQHLPLGIVAGTEYKEARHEFVPGDQVVFYTDGITEAMNPAGKMFGVERLDSALENCMLNAEGLIRTVLTSVEAFAEGHPADDDRTILVAKVF